MSFIEEIIDIIKRKRQTLSETIHPQGEGDPLKAQGIRVLDEEGEASVVGCYQSSGRAKQVQFVEKDDEDEATHRSHYSTIHWARDTIKTLVKVGDLEEPYVALLDHGSEINLMSKSLFLATYHCKAGVQWYGKKRVLAAS